jgi:hypothetical protein
MRRLDSSRAWHSSLDQHAQELFRSPALSARGLADLGRDLAQTAQLETAQTLDQGGVERVGAHWDHR